MIRPDLEPGGATTGPFHAGLTTGGYSPPLTAQQAQQTLSQQGRAGHPNYNIIDCHIIDCHGNYVYSVNDR